RRAVAVGPQRERRAHLRRRGVEGDVELHSLDQPVGRAVILKVDGAGLFSAHIRSAFREPPRNLSRSQPRGDSVGGGQMVTFLLIYPQFASCFNRFPGSRNPLYGCADNCGRNVMTKLRVILLVLAGMVTSILGTSLGASAQTYPNQVV